MSSSRTASGPSRTSWSMAAGFATPSPAVMMSAASFAGSGVTS
jgi:hypothetical protein